MRKFCLESYTLEVTTNWKLVTYRMYHIKSPRGLDRAVIAFLNLCDLHYKLGKIIPVGVCRGFCFFR